LRVFFCHSQAKRNFAQGSAQCPHGVGGGGGFKMTARWKPGLPLSPGRSPKTKQVKRPFPNARRSLSSVGTQHPSSSARPIYPLKSARRTSPFAFFRAPLRLGLSARPVSSLAAAAPLAQRLTASSIFGPGCPRGPGAASRKGRGPPRYRILLVFFISPWGQLVGFLSKIEPLPPGKIEGNVFGLGARAPPFTRFFVKYFPSGRDRGEPNLVLIWGLPGPRLGSHPPNLPPPCWNRPPPKNRVGGPSANGGPPGSPGAFRPIPGPLGGGWPFEKPDRPSPPHLQRRSRPPPWHGVCGRALPSWLGSPPPILESRAVSGRGAYRRPPYLPARRRSGPVFFQWIDRESQPCFLG